MKKVLLVLASVLSLSATAYADSACFDLRTQALRISGRAGPLDPDYYAAGFMAVFNQETGKIERTLMIKDDQGKLPVSIEDVGARATNPLALEVLDPSTGNFSLVLSIPDEGLASISAELVANGLSTDLLCIDQASFALKLPTEEDPAAYIELRLYREHGPEERLALEPTDPPIYSFMITLNLTQE